MLGWMMTCFPLAQFICAPILGQLADRYGRRRVLALSISGTGVAYILFAIGILTKNIPLMFFSRIMDGATGGNISVAQAVIGDISSPQNRAKNFGLIGMAFGLGFIVGPFLGGKLSDPAVVHWFNASTPFWFAAILSSINVISVLRNLPETLKVRSDKRIDLRRPIHNVIKAFSTNGLNKIIPATFLFNAGFTFYTTFWGVVLAEQFGYTQGHMVILAQGVLVRRLSGKIADYKVLRYSMFGTGLCLVAYYFIPTNHAWLIYVIPPFMAGCNALTFAFSTALITRISPHNIRGEAMGISSSANALAQAIPAILAGYIATHHARLPVMVGGITVICAGILFRYLFKAGRDDAHVTEGH
jgi:DHA1 family tetracycline resistance protein-like MFS transporter